MVNSSRDPTRPGLRAACSLASLVLLTTVVAIVMAAMRMGVMGGSSDSNDTGFFVFMGLCGLVVGAIAGAIVASQQDGGILGMILGTLTGMGFGAVAAILVALPSSMPVLGAGSLVLIVIAAVMRSFSRSRDDKESEEKSDPLASSSPDLSE